MRAPWTPAAAGVFICAALLAGCAAPQATGLVAHPPAGLPERVEIVQTPFFPQEAYQCGPAALATVLHAAHRAVTPESLVPQVYVPAREGSLQAEMLAAARRQGTVAYVLRTRLEDLLREVAAGTPVLVLQNLGLAWVPQWHYAVVIGYDLEARSIVLRSGVTRRLEMSLDTFEHTWARSSHWAVAVLPPGRLPATAEETRYVSALAALERNMPAAALDGYQAALARWPDSAHAGLGVGNARYALRDLPGAAAAYRRVAARHPDDADAWNNLAQTLGELGRREEALGAARRAVALGGPRLEHYRATLDALSRTP